MLKKTLGNNGVEWGGTNDTAMKIITPTFYIWIKNIINSVLLTLVVLKLVCLISKIFIIMIITNLGRFMTNCIPFQLLGIQSFTDYYIM